MSQEVDIAVLQEQMKTITASIGQLSLDLKDVKEDLKTFTTAIKTGKWIFGFILVTLGALGHKAWSPIVNYFTN